MARTRPCSVGTGGALVKAGGDIDQRRPLPRFTEQTFRAWFAARPSGTEDVYKVYAESFRGPDHLRQVQEEAQSVVNQALGE